MINCRFSPLSHLSNGRGPFGGKAARRLGMLNEVIRQYQEGGRVGSRLAVANTDLLKASQFPVKRSFRAYTAVCGIDGHA